MTRVRAVGQVDEVFDCRRINLFILRRDQESGHSDELDLGLGNLEDREVAVDEVNSEIKSFWQELELGMHADYPIDEDCAHVFVDVALAAHVESIWLRLLLRVLHVGLDFVAVEGHVIDV